MENNLLEFITETLKPTQIVEVDDSRVVLQLSENPHPLIVQITPLDGTANPLVTVLWAPLTGQGDPIPVGRTQTYIHGVRATASINAGYLRHRVDILLETYPHDFAQADAQRIERTLKTQEYNDTKALLLQTFEGRDIFVYENPNRKYFAVEVGPWKIYVVWGISGYGIKLVEDVSVEQVLKSLEAFSG